MEPHNGRGPGEHLLSTTAPSITCPSETRGKPFTQRQKILMAAAGRREQGRTRAGQVLCKGGWCLSRKPCLVQQQKERQKKNPAASHPIKTRKKTQQNHQTKNPPKNPNKQTNPKNQPKPEQIKIYPTISPSLTLGKNPWVQDYHLS